MAEPADRPAGPEATPEPDVRFLLANERTLLAYQRTAIGLMAAAIAVVHFLGDSLEVGLLGLAMILASAIAGVGGYQRFRQVDTAIRSGQPIGTGWAAHVVSLAVVICLLVAAAYVVARLG